MISCFLLNENRVAAQLSSWRDDALLNASLLHPLESAEAAMRNNMFVTVTTNKKSVFIGEPILAVYKFYSALNSHSTVVKQPQFNGCSVQELEYNMDAEQEVLSGKNYNVFIIRKVQLTPLQEGALQLGQAFVDNEVEFIDPDNPFESKKYSISLSSKSQHVKVNALPLKNKPRDFSGITGNFSLKIKVISNSIPVNENGHLIITIKGAGNIQAIDQPEINWPEDIEHFDGSDTQHINQSDFPVSGDKVFNILYLGKHEGKATLPPVSFNFFNTATQTYSTIHTDSIPIIFTKAIAKKNVWASISKEAITNRKYLWIVAGIAGIVSVVFLVSYKRNRKNKAIKKKESENRVSDAEQVRIIILPEKQKTDFAKAFEDLKAAEYNKDFFIKSKAILTAALKESAGMFTSIDEIQVLNQPSATELKKDIESFYSTCDFALYSSIEADNNLPLITEQLQSIVTRVKVLEV